MDDDCKNLSGLRDWLLADGVLPGAFGLGEIVDDAPSLVRLGATWWFIYEERGTRRQEVPFETFTAAREHFLKALFVTGFDPRRRGS